MCRYHAGKTKQGKNIASAIMKHIQQENYEIQSYCEPFSGMCGVMKRIVPLLQERKPSPKLYAGDLNADVIQLWQELLLKGEFLYFPTKTTKEEYEELKQEPQPSSLRGFVGCVASWNGQFFGSYNQSQGHLPYTIKTLYEDAKIMRNVEFLAGSYEQFSHLKNSIIYCDPPYEKTTFLQNNKLLKFDYEAFYEWARKMSKNNLVYISAYTKPFEECIEIWSEEKIRKTRGFTLRKEKLFFVTI